MSRPSLLGLNPEFQRQLWLELTPTRLWAVPLALGVIFGGVYLLSSLRSVFGYADAAIWVLLILWGTRLAADGFSEEVNGHTWDVQRLSVSNPWALAVGKLLGGSACAWYGTAFCIAAMFAADPGRARSALPGLLIGGISAQSAALFAALVLYRRGRRRRGSTALAQLFGILWGLSSLAYSFAPMLPFVPRTNAAPVPSVPAPHLLPPALPGPNLTLLNPLMTWYGMPLPRAEFMLASQLLMAVWMWVGTAAMIRRELGGRGGPLVWTLFTLYSCVMAAGSDEFGLRLEVMLPFQVAMIAVGLTYVALFATPLSLAEVKRLRLALRDGELVRLWRELPTWMPSALIAVAAMVVLAIMTVIYAAQPNPVLGTLGPTSVFGWLGNFLRDLILVSWVRLQFGRRTGLAIALGLILLYALFPAVTLRFAGPDWAQLFLPRSATSLPGLLGPWAIALLLAALLVRFVRRHANPVRIGG